MTEQVEANNLKVNYPVRDRIGTISVAADIC
jgi:hypothetical protein